jgi:hypothetical protein
MDIRTVGSLVFPAGGPLLADRTVNGEPRWPKPLK